VSFGKLQKFFFKKKTFATSVINHEYSLWTIGKLLNLLPESLINYKNSQFILETF
jgi:hypothetical protein